VSKNIILIILVLILGAVLIKYWPFGQGLGTTPETDINATDDATNNVFESNQDIIGTIEAIDGNKVTIKAEKERNQTEEDRVVTVVITDETEWCIPPELLYDEEFDEAGGIVLVMKERAFNGENLSKKYETSEMEIGKVLMVSSESNATQEDFLTATFACYYP